MEGSLFAIGNPLLDMSIKTDDNFLKKYNLKPNDAVIADESHMNIYDEMESNYTNIEYTPGGATQNTIRVVQWIVNKPNTAIFMGCIAKDKRGDIMREQCEALKVNVCYQYTDKAPTGTCAVLITGESNENRSLCANLAAANHFSSDFLKLPENWALVEKAKFFYISGFVLTVSVESMELIGKHAAETNKLFSTNISAPFLCQFFKTQMNTVLPYIDLVFGNETEADIFAKENNFKDKKNLDNIALEICELPKVNKARSRMVVFTQGASTVLIAQDGKVEHFDVPKLPKIVDTNGAGDAFCGGFLSQLIQNKPIAECVRCGIYAAQFMIQQIGCSLDTPANFV